MEDITVRAFAPADQDAARRLIIQGLGEHFGFVDEGRNPDLDDIAASYRDGVFLVALAGDELIGTGALNPMGRGAVQVVRMSTARQRRRQGVGRGILERLLDEARASGYRWAVLETNAGWEDAIAFYRANAFSVIGRAIGGVAFTYRLSGAGGRPPLPLAWSFIAQLFWRHFTSR
ncbi:MAG: GNAT family N-acetyltransferase [Dehalococcoidia bacterium]